MFAWIKTRSGWILDRKHPDKMAARVFAVMLALLSMAMAANLYR
jgi:hypothetical protein